MMIKQSAKVIRPTELTDSMLVSSVAPETDFPVWAAATAYTAGQKAIKAHRIYQRAIAGTTAVSPELDSVNWVDIGPTNRWAMFDNVVGTQTSVAGALAVTVSPGSLSGLALLELVGRSVNVSLKTAPGGSVVYDKSISLDGTVVTSFYDWFYQPFVQMTSCVLTDLPFHFPRCELSISISITSGNSACGVCKFGEVIGLGSAGYGATSGITDYSVKTADAFGRYSVVRRGYSKKMSFKILTERFDYNRISLTLANLRATPAVWIASESSDREPLTVYGFYKDFSIEVAYPMMNYCSIEIEGLI